MDRLAELAVLAAILDTGSLAGAARRLRRSPPAVTRTLATLEERVGTRLLQRSTRQLTPTEAGRRLATHARQLLTDYEQAVTGLKENQQAPINGMLRITAPSLFGRMHVAPLVFDFLDAHPGIRVDLVLTNRDLDMIEDGIDVAVRIGPLERVGLIAHRVGHVRRVLSASPEYIASRGRPRAPRDLLKHDIVHNWTRPSPVEWRFRSSGRDLVVRPTPRLMTTEVDALLVAIRAGRGIGRTLSYQVAADWASGALVRLLREFESPPMPVHLVVSRARHIPRSVRAFLDHAAPALEALRVIQG